MEEIENGGPTLTGGVKNLAPPVRVRVDNMYPTNIRAGPPCPSVFNIEGCGANSHEPTATAQAATPNIECVGFEGRRRRQLHGASVSMALAAL